MPLVSALGVLEALEAVSAMRASGALVALGASGALVTSLGRCLSDLSLSLSLYPDIRVVLYMYLSV